MGSLREKLGRFNPRLPLDQAETIPSLWYFDEEIYQWEKKTVFAKTWQLVGRAEQLKEPGSFITADVAGEPILVARDKGGTLRAFSNVCRHKGARVAIQSEGKAPCFQCRYHGWTYDLSGWLRGTPEFEGVQGFRKEDHGLAPLTVETWENLVFIHQGKNPHPLTQFLSPLPEKTAELGLNKLHFVERKEYVLQCNWKVFIDNYLDGGYHVNTIHPRLAGVLDYSQYRTEIHPHSSCQLSPINSAGADKSIASVRKGKFAHYWWVYPNLMINIYDGVMDTNLVLPLGTDRSRVLFDFYFSETATAEARQFIETSMATAHQIQLEDVEICEDVQRGLASSTYDTGRFSVRREAGIHHFHCRLGQVLQDGSS